MTYFWLKRSELHNFAEDNTISATGRVYTHTLEHEFKSVVLWFKQKEMIVNLDKFQAIILKNKSKTKGNLNICNENVNITDTIK